MRTFTKADAAYVQANGLELRKRTTIRVVKIDEEAIVETEEGTLTVKPPFYLATDGTRVWPIDEDYLSCNYVNVSGTLQ